MSQIYIPPQADNVNLTFETYQVPQADNIILTFGETDLILTPDLIQAREDIKQIIEEQGESVTLYKLTRTYDDVGQIQQRVENSFIIKGLFDIGDVNNFSNQAYGETITGEQSINLLHEYIINNQTIRASVGDYIEDRTGNRWRITRIENLHIFGGVFHIDCKLQKVNNEQL